MRTMGVSGIAAALTLVLALPASADSITGGCTVNASSDVDSTNVTDATSNDPFEIDPAGSLSWTANSAGPIKNHTWAISTEVGGIPVRLAQGGDPNDDGTVTSTGEESIPGLIAMLEEKGSWPATVAPLLSELSGIYKVSGSISGEGGSCSGVAWVRLGGFGGIGLGGAAAAAIGALLMISAGRAPKG
jgi:hypothetical protein